MSKYEPLSRYLIAHREDEVPMTFAELEHVLGFPLPASAHKHQAWWANTQTHSYAEAWMGVGRRTERLDLVGRRVVFVAKRNTKAAETESAADPTEGAVLSISALSSRSVRMIEDRADADASSLDAAMASILEDVALERRQRLIDQIGARAPKVSGNSVDLIREDRDAR